MRPVASAVRTFSGAPRNVVVAPGAGAKRSHAPHDALSGRPVDRRVPRPRASGASVAAAASCGITSAVPASSARSASTTSGAPSPASRAPRRAGIVVGRIGSARAASTGPVSSPSSSSITLTPVAVVALEDRPLHRRGAAPPRQQREVQVQAAEPRDRQDLGRQDAPVGDDHERIGARGPRSHRLLRPFERRRPRSTRDPAPGRLRHRRWPPVDPRPAGRGGFVMTRTISTSAAAASALEGRHRPCVVAEEDHPQARVSPSSGRRRSRGRGSSSPSSIRRSSRHHRAAALLVEAIDVQRAVEVIGLVLEDAREQSFTGRSRTARLHVLTAAGDRETRVRRVVRTRDRQTAFLLHRLARRRRPAPGLAMNIGPVSPSSKTNSRIDRPTCGPARPTPGASYIVSSMSSHSVASAASNSTTGALAGRVAEHADRRGFGSGRITWTPAVRCRSTGAAPPRPGRRPPAAASSRTARPNAGTRSRRRARASIPSDPRRSRRASSIGANARERALQLGGPPATRNTARPDREAGLGATSASRRDGSAGVAADQRLHGRIVGVRGLHDRAAVGASPGDRLHPGRQRALASGEARATLGEIRRRGSPRGRARPRPRSRTSSGPPTGSRPRSGKRGARPGSSRRTGTAAGADAHSSTRSGRRGEGRSRRAAMRARPSRLAHDAPNHGPPSARAARRTRRTPPAARTTGRPRRCRSRAAARTGTPGAPSPSARTSRGARPSGPGFTISTGGHRRPVGVDGGQARAPRSPSTGTAHESTTVAPLDAPHAPAPRPARGSTAPDPRDAPDGTRARPRSGRGRGTGANTAGRVPTTTSNAPAWTSSHVR